MIFLIKNSFVNIALLENKTREIKAGVYLLLAAKMVNNVQQIGTGALLTFNNYILGLIWENDSIY